MLSRALAVTQLMLVLAFPQLVDGQSSQAATGSRVRLRMITGLTVEGRLQQLGADSLILLGDAGRIIVPRAGVRSLETWKGRGSQWRSGAELGWFAGFVATSAVYAMRMRNCIGVGCAGIVKLNAVAATGGLAGALVGGFVGAAIPHDRWERLPLGPAHPQIAVGAGAASVGLSIQF